ncbi:hypothetical protein CRYUN_Cryun22dG0080600 [Craigia yunnanensis]
MLTRNSIFKTPQSTPLRRSARLLNQKTPTKSKDLNTQKAKSKEIPARSTVKISKKSIKSSNGSTNCVNSTSGLRRSPRLNSVSSKLSTNCVNSASGLRKSPRLNSGSLCNKPEESKFVDTKKTESRKNKSIKGGLLDEEKRVLERNEREICVGLKAVTVEGRESERREICDRNEDVGVKRERKRKSDVGGDGIVQGWTREQELALQRAYFSAKPTPNFWKKVSKLKKTVRHLLRKHYHVDQGDEADLFSILEPNTSSSMHALPNVMLSTPKNLLEKQGFLLKCNERSSSGPKKHHSKLGNSCTGALISPPVLKQIKNRALHEKYIDQLHNREAKRRAESTRAEKEVLGKENRGSIQILKIDKVRVAKNALVSDARYVINQLHHLQTTSADNSLDMDNDDDESEV